MDEATKQQLIAAGREDLVEAHEITVSGYAGVMPKNGMIVDRRKHPEAIPARKNTALGIPEPKELPNVRLSMRTITENDVKMHCVNTGGREFMCKSCGDKYDALATVRHYCEKCGCWVCPRCALKSNLCAECSND